MATLAEKFAKNKPQTLAEKFAPKVQETPRTTGGIVAPTFTAKAGENPLIAGAKAIGNVPSSAFGLGKGLFEAVKNPIGTVKAVGGLLSGAGSKVLENTVGRGVEALTGKPVQKADTQAFDLFGQVMKERYGSLEALQKTATEDPVGFGADLLSIIEGGASVIGKTPQLTSALSKTGQLVTKPVAKTLGAVGEGIKSTAQFGVSQATGLNPETIRELVQNPQKFKNINPELRIETANKVAEALDTRLGELSDVGKGYEAIRQFDVPVMVPEDTVSKVLNKYGVKLDKDSNIVTSPESRPLSATDRNALQDFINNYGKETELTSNSFLNTREALSNLSKFEQGKTALPTQIARDLRASYDALGKQQIPGLANLDTVYAPERQLLGQLKKDIFDARGDLKDTAISKIANLTGKGKEQVLERVRQIVPDIEERVKLVKAVEDIERASGLKTATYVRSGIVGTGALTGNIPAIIGAIISQPEIAAPLLRGAGYVGQKALPILQAIKDFANDINNFTVPKPIVDYAKNPKLGMSIEDVTKTNPLITEAKKYKSAEEFVKDVSTSEIRYQLRGGLDKIAKETDIKSLSGTQKVGEETVAYWKKRIEENIMAPGNKGTEGFAPIIVDGNKVVDGFHKLQAYKELGFGKVPTIDKSQLTDIWNKANKK